MFLYHNSRNLLYKSPFGACEINTNIHLRLDVYDAIPGLQVFLSLFYSITGPKKIEMNKTICENNLTVYEIDFPTPSEPQIVWYSFIAKNYNEQYYYSNNTNELGGEGRMAMSNPVGYQLTVYKKQKSPSWFKEGIAYQIFPDRFNRGIDYAALYANTAIQDTENNRHNYLEANWFEAPEYIKDEKGNVIKWQYFGGTLNGIKNKIQYLKSLGVTVLYLNPIFEAHSNHKYNTANYKKIDPHLGDEESLKQLIEECKNNNIHIILDGVFSHTGKDSIYFNDAKNNKDSIYYSWYKWKKYPNEYECWWNVDDLPNVDELNENYSNYIYKDEDSVIKHWLKLGIDGFRLDVADELPDEFIKGIRKSIDETNPNAVLLGEVWEDASNKRAYNELREYFWGDELHSVMNYCFRTDAIDFFMGKIDAEEFFNKLYNIMEHYPEDVFYSNFNIIGTHDTKRILSVLAEGEPNYNLATQRLKLLSLMQMTMPGIPCIYYGDEAGLTGNTDPDNRKTYPWGKENTVLLDHYRKIQQIRNSSKAFSIGSFTPLFFGKHVIAYKRAYENECYLVLINRGIFPDENMQIEYDLTHNNDTKHVSINLNNLSYEIIKL